MQSPDKIYEDAMDGLTTRESVKQVAIQRAKGRIKFLRDIGRVKDSSIMQELVDIIEAESN